MRLLMMVVCVVSCIQLWLLPTASANSQAHLTTFTGGAIAVDNTKITHLVFIDLWRSYEGQGDETLVASLPETFLQRSQQIWIQPEINVTKAQLTEFQQFYPQIQPLVLDHNFTVMRSHNIWQAPYHVLLQDGVQLFAGNGEALNHYITTTFAVGAPLQRDTNGGTLPALAAGTTPLPVASSKTVADNGKRKAPVKPLPGDPAPEFALQTMTGEAVSLSSLRQGLTHEQPLSLVFLDSLCPMPHFPDCEAKLARLNQLVASEPERRWLGVVSSFYVSEESVKQFRQQFALKLPFVFDRGNKLFKRYDVYATPYQIDINREGVIESRTENLH